MKNKRLIRPYPLIGMLTGALALTLILNIAQAGRVNDLTVQVNSAYQKALFETTTLIDRIGLNLEKLLITGSAAKEQELLSEIARQSESAQDNLSMLPSGHASVSGPIKFINQTGDFARTLSDRLATGGAVSDADRETLILLRRYCDPLREMLNGMTDDLLNGQNPFEEAGAVAGWSADMPDEVEPAVDYPALLYDGPFSDGRDGGVLRAVSGREFTGEEAIARAKGFIGDARVLSAGVTGEGETPAPCYEITVKTTEGELNMAVTRQGGEMIYMLFDGAAGPARFSQGELVDLAAAFLKSRGYPNAVVSYWSFYDGILTVNFAAVQDDVVLYPDLIKLQMDASTGQVVGMEAIGYLTNHTYRENLTPTISRQEAVNRLGALLTPGRVRLCVIPTDEGEALAWECDCTLEDSRYLVYIDARTGQEREIYRVIEDDSGQVVV